MNGTVSSNARAKGLSIPSYFGLILNLGVLTLGRPMGEPPRSGPVKCAESSLEVGVVLGCDNVRTLLTIVVKNKAYQ